MWNGANPIAVAMQIAERQRGLVDRDQLVQAGVPVRTIARLIESEELVELCHQVYRFGGSVLEWKDRLKGAIKWGGELAAASHRSGARLHGLSIRSDVIEITIPRRVRAPEGVIVHYSHLNPIDVQTVGGVRTMSAARTLLTLGSVVPLSLLERLMDEVLISQKANVNSLLDVLMREGRRGVRGVSKFRSLLEKRIALPAAISNELERHLNAIFRNERLPLPVPQHTIQVGGDRFRPDFCYPELKIAIEGDGHQFHLSRQARENDLERQNLLILDGWLVLRFTWEMVTRQPKMVAEIIRNAIESRQSTRRR